MNKLQTYHMLRRQGVRLYVNRSWIKASMLSPSTDTCYTTPVYKRCIHSSPVSWRQKYTFLDGDFNDEYMEPGFWKKFLIQHNIRSQLKYPPLLLSRSGLCLYLSLNQAVIYNDIISQIGVEDTFRTWHSVMALHVWMLMLRLERDAHEGRMIRNRVISCWQQDTKEQIKAIGAEMAVTLNRSENENLLHLTFMKSNMFYDHGYLGDDKDLAGALWAFVFNRDENVDPRNLATMVQYTRKQIRYLDKIPSDYLMTSGVLPFAPLVGSEIDKSVYEQLDPIRGVSNDYIKT